MDVGAGAGTSIVTGVDVNEYVVPPPTGVAVIMIRGRVADPETPVMIPVFWTRATVAIDGSSDVNVKFGGMIVPPCAVRAVAKICVWKPAGKLELDELKSIQLMPPGFVTGTGTDVNFVMPLETAVAVIDAGLPVEATPDTTPVWSTVAIV